MQQLPDLIAWAFAVVAIITWMWEARYWKRKYLKLEAERRKEIVTITRTKRENEVLNHWFNGCRCQWWREYQE